MCTLTCVHLRQQIKCSCAIPSSIGGRTSVKNLQTFKRLCYPSHNSQNASRKFVVIIKKFNKFNNKHHIITYKN